jgi:hypothetical protein
MVEKKIEDIRVKQEIALTNKLQGAFNNSLNNLNEDKVQTTQAAPVAPAPVAPAPVVETRIIEVAAPPVKEEKKSNISVPYANQAVDEGASKSSNNISNKEYYNLGLKSVVSWNVVAYRRLSEY